MDSKMVLILAMGFVQISMLLLKSWQSFFTNKTLRILVNVLENSTQAVSLVKRLISTVLKFYVLNCFSLEMYIYTNIYTNVHSWIFGVHFFPKCVFWKNSGMHRIWHSLSLSSSDPVANTIIGRLLIIWRWT